MSYCAVSDVENLIPTLGTFSTTTKPTLVQAGEYVDQVATEMRGVLAGNGYDPDPTDENACEALRRYNALGAAAMVLRAARAKDTSMSDSYQQAYEAALERIRRGEIVGLTRTESGRSVYPRYNTNTPDPPYWTDEDTYGRQW